MFIRTLAAAVACMAALSTPALADEPPTIHASEPGLWDESGRKLELTEDLAIGVEDGDEDYVFGKIGEMTVDADGNLYVIDTGFICVKKFNSDGEFLLQFGQEGEGPGEFRNPLAIATDAEDRVYVAGFGTIVNIFDSDGTYVGGFSENLFGLTNALQVATDGTVFAVSYDESTDKMIQVYSPQHEYVRTFCDSWAAGTDTPLDEKRMSAVGRIDLAPDGTLYYAQGHPYEIRQFAADGTLLRRIVRENDFMVPIKVTRSGDRVSFRVGSACYRIVVFADGSFLNATRVPSYKDDKDIDWTTVLDLFDREGRLLATTRVEGNRFLGCADNEGRLWWSDLREFPRVVRWAMGPPGGLSR
jgi:hypothetical protein